MVLLYFGVKSRLTDSLRWLYRYSSEILEIKDFFICLINKKFTCGLWQNCQKTMLQRKLIKEVFFVFQKQYTIILSRYFKRSIFKCLLKICRSFLFSALYPLTTQFLNFLQYCVICICTLTVSVIPQN